MVTINIRPNRPALDSAVKQSAGDPRLLHFTPAIATGLSESKRTRQANLVRLQHAQPQKVDIRAAIHLALEELEPVDMTLSLAIAPWQPEGRPYSR